ncbi:MAG: winged helix-turn-helix transcriptional regulator [Rhodospirillaceae bacterium]|jgi:DNA-binding MarR family transcriptional regulator|nr:winged helix-turn-helix transcriptional regulator [Rhodospirillaceae bacterium]MBT4220507.1 winged helix-turn-helix transcriptional regulator [Rhodospirillaceae bacterium]MBT4463068.1 winged helix-turn-helix transcriptional regulator [Rhodospirillaceae bacterium]MBT5309375.1 winged helix-turn-helix transcriptional regulator [Rhodospirillaceae bacterium]MBT6406276.1 winged helix-turn-helix transcriptional regulator [Rhodospirillaceae bacterium]
MAENENDITLGLLNTVEENSNVTQRVVANDLGIALGLANSYLKRCITKGLIKVSQAPKNRYAYYLTPQGFAEKSRLTAEYLSQSLNLFRVARKESGELLDLCTERGWNKVVFVGTGDLGEIATLCAREHTIEIIGFVDATDKDDTFAGLPVFGAEEGFNKADAAIVTDMKTPQATFEFALESLTPDRVLAPRFLRVSRNHLKESASEGKS